MPPLLLLLTFLLPPEAGTEEIIGGHEAKPHSRPYMALVLFTSGEKRSCGGVLVQEGFVLTAAHCEGSSVKVILGAHNIKRPEKTQEVIRVRKATPHPDFVHKTLSNDILLLQKKATLTKAVQPLRLPMGNTEVRPVALCHVAGWRRLGPEGVYPSTLQEVEVTVQKDEKCQTCFKRFYNSATQMCVPSRATLEALSCNNVFQAMVSYGKRNGNPPQVFPEVSPFLHWIKEIMKHH
ncbi:Granzyme B(G,H) [Fukomys damarensis]|uniref:Granzyme B(G,H) n=1 Tax=Fukomys damarensis TaxID=885580 RepID=A0A091DNP6_FUKDA|nr:Granzyme B(G,H) [Fukomys damarensis]